MIEFYNFRLIPFSNTSSAGKVHITRSNVLWNSPTENDAGRSNTFKTSVRTTEAFANPSSTAYPQQNKSAIFSTKYIFQILCLLFFSALGPSADTWAWRSKASSRRVAIMLTTQWRNFISAQVKIHLRDGVLVSCGLEDMQTQTWTLFPVFFRRKFFPILSFLIHSNESFSSNGAFSKIPVGHTVAYFLSTFHPTPGWFIIFLWFSGLQSVHLFRGRSSWYHKLYLSKTLSKKPRHYNNISYLNIVSQSPSRAFWISGWNLIRSLFNYQCI